MLEFFSSKKNPLIKIFSFVILITLIMNLVNINFEVENYRLSRSINDIEENKSILRAQYLSDTAISKLDYKATALKMSEISNENCTKLSKAIQDHKFKEIKKDHDLSHVLSHNADHIQLEKQLSGF